MVCQDLQDRKWFLAFLGKQFWDEEQQFYINRFYILFFAIKVLIIT